MADTAAAVQQAVYDALDAAFGALPTPIPVTTLPRPDQAFPFVRIDRHTIGADDTMAETGSEHFVFVSCWSDERGDAEVLSMLETVQAALHDADLQLSTGQATLTRVSERRTDLDADGVTMIGAATIRVATQH